MKLTGSYELNVNKESVWKALNDPNILKKCIPGCESFEKESDTVFNAFLQTCFTLYVFYKKQTH